MLLDTARKTSLRGITRNVEWHEEKSHQGWFFYVLTFQLEQIDRTGNVMGYAPIEFRTRRIRNVAENGDDVEVIGRKKPRRIIEALRIVNLSKEVEISAGGGEGRAKYYGVMLIPFGLALFGGGIQGWVMGIFIAVFFISAMALFDTLHGK